MATPRNFTRTALSGETLYAGRTPPAVPAPAWMSSAVVGAWNALPNSAGAGSAAVNAYSGYVFDDALRLWIAGAGGHTNSPDNRVVMYDAGVDTPTGWELKKAPSSTVVSNVPYYPDGLPVSTHTYDYTFWCPSIRRIIRFGAYGIYETGFGSNTIDGFNVDTNEWDPAGTYPYTRGSSWSNDSYNYGATQDKVTGNIIWADQGFKMWTPAVSNVQNFVNKTGINVVRFPNAWDYSRNGYFGLVWGDGQDSGSGITANQTLNPSSATPTSRAITFNPSAALTQFQTDGPAYAGMDYDILRDKFLFVYGSTNGIGGPPRVIEITPNSSAVWDMGIYTPGSGNPGQVVGDGVNGRFKYVRRGAIGGFVFMSHSSNGLYFLRTQ